MRKKIFSKLTKERKEEFQIETSIVIEEDGCKKVIKSAIGQKAKEHIREIYENYIYYKKHGVDTLVPCVLIDDAAEFEFIQGKSCCYHLLSAIWEQNLDQFYKLLKSYKLLVESTALEKEEFYASTEFQEVFGVHEELNGKQASKYLNVDMSFDNIIFKDNGEVSILDYEWILKFPVPVDFIIYRAILGFYSKYGKRMADFATIDNMMDFMNITMEEQNIYREMDQEFVNYVNGTGDSYANMLNQYKKDVYYLSDVTGINTTFAQVFVDTGDGYIEERAYKAFIGAEEKEVCLQIDLSGYEQIKAIRIDPMNTACILDVSSIRMSKENGEAVEFLNRKESLLHNAVFLNENILLFAHQDPQIILDEEIEGRYESLKVSFSIIEHDLSKVGKGTALISESFSRVQTEFKELEEQYGIILDVKQGLEKRLNSLANENSLMKIKLSEDSSKEIEEISTEQSKIEAENAYIKSTKAYKLFLEKKVNKNVHGMEK
jgi:hypothetical protein